MIILEDILVVEGTNDASYLASFIKGEIVVLNGCELKDLDYLKEASKKTKILLLTDPDDEGMKIRNRINKEINCINIYVDRSCCNRNNKHGVAECSMNEILFNISKYGVSNENHNETISLNDVILLENKSEIKEKYKLGNCNTKTMYKRLNRLEIRKEDICK